MKKLALLALLIPALSFGQTIPLVDGPYSVDARTKTALGITKGVIDWLNTQPYPTGRTRTVRSTFQTIYTPRTYKGWVMEREMQIANSPSYWEPIGYSRRKTLLFRKKYSLWEIYNPIYKK